LIIVSEFLLGSVKQRMWKSYIDGEINMKLNHHI